METIISGFQAGLEQMTWLEAIAVIFGLLSVWYAKNENILVFPTGIISVLIYVHICFGAKLYADMGINAYYFVMSIYGWYKWSTTSEEKEILPISRTDRNEKITAILLFIGSYFVLNYSLRTFTDSDVPQWDALTTSLAFTAMWLMAKKKIENWIAWILTDLISVPLYFHKGYLLTSFQFFVFLILAIAGLISWIKSYRRIQNASI